jgi:hypothetical protein
MKRQVGFLIFVFLTMSVLSNAQSNCPQGFAYVGTLSGTGSATQEFNKKVVLKLPESATFDESFQQIKVKATSAKGKSNLRPQDIPKGILIIPHGSNDREKVWSVSKPKLAEINEDGTSSTRHEFGMHLFCRVESSPYSQQTGGCDVQVEVCYKPKSKN